MNDNNIIVPFLDRKSGLIAPEPKRFSSIVKNYGGTNETLQGGAKISGYFYKEGINRYYGRRYYTGTWGREDRGISSEKISFVLSPQKSTQKYPDSLVIQNIDKKYDKYSGKEEPLEIVFKRGFYKMLYAVAPLYETPVCSDIQTFDSKTGHYSLVRKSKDAIVGGYQYNMFPDYSDRKFAKGIHGKLQKLALRIGTKSNGCERLLLRRVSAYLFNIANKIK